MFISTADYGTKQYLKEYIDEFFSMVRLVKLKNREMIIGFVHDGTYTNQFSIDFPYEAFYEDGEFCIREYTPELKLKTVPVPKSEIMFISELDEELHMMYLDLLEAVVFNSGANHDLTDDVPEGVTLQ